MQDLPEDQAGLLDPRCVSGVHDGVVNLIDLVLQLA